MSGRARFRVGAVGVALLGAFAYLWRLGVPSWQNDEVVYAEAGAALVGGDLTATPEQPPLAKWVFGLAQQVVGDAQLAVRLAAAAGGLAAGWLLYVLVRDLVAGGGAAGRAAAGDPAGAGGASRASWLGLLAAGLWFALPHTLVTASVGLDKLDRYGRLEAVAVVPMLAALVAGWRWVTDGGCGGRPGGREQAARRWAAGTGALAGLAAAAKPTFGLVLPAVGLVVLARRRGGPWGRLGRVAASAVVSLGVLLAAYLPHGTGAPAALWRTVRMQLGHAGAGHPVELAGVVHQHAPWWAGLWFTWRDDGPVLTVTLAVLVVAAVVLGVRSRDGGDRTGGWRLPAGYLGAAAAVPVVVLALSPVALPHYRFVWLPPVVALAALGLAAVWRRARPAAGVAGLALAGVAAAHLGGVTTARPAGYAAAAGVLREVGAADGRVLVRGYDRVVGRYVPGRVVDGLPAAAVVIDRAWARRVPAPRLDRRIGALSGCRVTIDGLTVVVPGRASCPPDVP